MGPSSQGANHFFARTHFLACEDVAGGSQQSGGNFFSAKYGGPSCGSQQSGGNDFFAKYWWPVRWVPAVRWRNNYFPRNKEALPCGCHGPSYQPLHVQYSSDGSRSFTTLITPRGEHQGGGRRRGRGRGRRGAREDVVVDAHAERRTRVHCFIYGVRLPSPQNNKRCG